MSDDNNKSIFFNKSHKTLNGRICCSHVKSIITPSQDKTESIFIGDNDLNITTEQRDEWFDDIKEAFPEFVFKVKKTEDINTKLSEVKLPENIFKDSKSRKKYINEIQRILIELLEKKETVKIALVGGETIQTGRDLVEQNRIWLADSSVFSGYLMHGKKGLEVYTSFMNVKIFIKGKISTTLDKYVFKELGFDTLKNPGVIIDTNFHLIKIKPTSTSKGMDSLLRLILHTFLRYTWSRMYHLYLPTYFKIKAKLPKKEMLELLSLANITAHAKPYYSLFLTEDNGLLTNEFLRDRIDGHLRNLTTYSTINGLSERRLLHKNYSIIKGLMKEDKYEEAFNLFEFSTLGKSQAYKFRLQAKKDYGFLSKDTIYNPVAGNDKSYKIMADDYCHRWYKKNRFNKIEE